MQIGGGSRVPTLIDALIAVNGQGDQKKLRTIIERAADPRDFIGDEDRLEAVIKYLNARFEFDGLQITRQGKEVRLAELGAPVRVVSDLSATAASIDFDTVNRDLERALASVKTDPEDAVTSACSVVESVCRSILIELGMPLPSKKDIQGLYQAVREPLGLAPDKSGIDEQIVTDVRSILGGLNTVVNGIGALRTHGGDAHGRDLRQPVLVLVV